MGIFQNVFSWRNDNSVCYLSIAHSIWELHTSNLVVIKPLVRHSSRKKVYWIIFFGFCVMLDWKFVTEWQDKLMQFNFHLFWGIFYLNYSDYKSNFWRQLSYKYYFNVCQRSRPMDIQIKHTHSLLFGCHCDGMTWRNDASIKWTKTLIFRAFLWIWTMRFSVYLTWDIEKAIEHAIDPSNRVNFPSDPFLGSFFRQKLKIRIDGYLCS